MLDALVTLDQTARGPKDADGGCIYEAIVHQDIKRE
jgi:hypothetical protein